MMMRSYLPHLVLASSMTGLKAKKIIWGRERKGKKPWA